jgi:hypothetical protein
MVMDDLCDQLEAFLTNGAHTMKDRRQLSDEIAVLRATRYSGLRAHGGPDDWLMQQAFPKPAPVTP